jgi:hypothetical protein
MILDYIGQELIWNLRGENPYRENKFCWSTYYRCKSFEENIAICQFITKHISLVHIETIVQEDSPFPNGNRKIARQINVKNVFGGINSLNIINDYDGETKQEDTPSTVK